MPVSPTEVAAVAASAVCGCLATSVAFQAVTGKPASEIASNWRKYVWSVVFVLPVLLVFHLPISNVVAFFVMIFWLIVAPSVAAKYIFGPKEAEWSILLMLHSAFSFTTIAFVLLLYKLLGIVL